MGSRAKNRFTIELREIREREGDGLWEPTPWGPASVDRVEAWLISTVQELLSTQRTKRKNLKIEPGESDTSLANTQAIQARFVECLADPLLEGLWPLLPSKSRVQLANKMKKVRHEHVHFVS